MFMYVCLCMGVTDREVKEAIREGACSVPEVMRCTAAGTRCGSCQPTINVLLHRAGHAPPSSCRQQLVDLEDLLSSTAA
jgi:bacterioferritin-associated ferredoxin